MYTIGEFSRISGLSNKALRLYHEKGLVVPKSVDPVNGYRFYSDDELERARVISTLKTMGCSLAEILHLMSQFSDDADAIEFLQAKHKSLALEMNRLKQVSAAIDSAIQQAARVNTMKLQAQVISIKDIEPLIIMSQRWAGRYVDTGKVLGPLYRMAGRYAAGASFNLYYDGEYKDSDADIETCLPVKAAFKKKEKIRTLEGGCFASLIHQGPYDTLGVGYAQLFEYIKNNDYKVAEIPVREIYHKGPGMIFKGNPAKYVTEILIPILKER